MEREREVGRGRGRGRRGRERVVEEEMGLLKVGSCEVGDRKSVV